MQEISSQLQIEQVAGVLLFQQAHIDRIEFDSKAEHDHRL